jgi:hypothetical protein
MHGCSENVNRTVLKNEYYVIEKTIYCFNLLGVF